MEINVVTGTLMKVELVPVTGTAHLRTTDDAGLNYIDASSHVHYVELTITRGTVDDVRMKGSARGRIIEFAQYLELDNTLYTK